MQPHSRPAYKERPFLPGFKSAGLPGPFSVVMWNNVEPHSSRQ